MKLLEIGTIVLFCACCLRTCSPSVDKSMADIEIEYFATCFDDKTISIVRTRQIYSADPWKWENPVPADKGVFESDAWVAMSNMYAIVVNDSSANKFAFKRGSAEIYYRHREMTPKGSNYVFNARNDTLEQIDVSSFNSLAETNDCGSVMRVVVDLEGIFARHKSCPCIFFGNGKTGVLFWRGGLDYRWREEFMRLLWVGRPYDYYTVKKFKTWDDFLKWDGVLQITGGITRVRYAEQNSAELNGGRKPLL